MPDPDMDAGLDAWLPLVFVVKSLNRSMVIAGLCPFVVSDEVRAKLAFMHGIVHATTGRSC